MYERYARTRDRFRTSWGLLHTEPSVGVHAENRDRPIGQPLEESNELFDHRADDVDTVGAQRKRTVGSNEE